MKRRCDTCQKLKVNGKCAVLKENLGQERDCWAWTSDPGWEKKVNEAIKEYKEVR